MKINLKKIFVVIGFLFIMLISAKGYNILAAKTISNQNQEQTSDIDKLAKSLMVNGEYLSFYELDDEQMQGRSGYKVTEYKSKEDFSVVNSTMHGVWSVYKVDSHFVFCVQPGMLTLSQANKVSESKSKYTKFSSTSKEYVSKVISSATYNYNRTKNTDYIFAGQLLIWDYLSKHELKVLDNPLASWNPNYLKSWRIDNSKLYKSELNVIRGDLKKWKTLPSFLGTSKTKPKKFNLKFNEKTNTFSIVLTDKNGVWDKKYANYTDYNNLKITNPSGKDNVKIETTKEFPKYTPAKPYTWKPTISGYKNFYDSGQDLAYVGPNLVNGYIQFKTDKKSYGGFQLTKVGKDENGNTHSLSGAKFKVTSKDVANFSKIYSTDKEGLITTSNSELKYGKYHIEEIEAPSGYVGNYKADFEIKEAGKIVHLNNGKPIENDLYTNKVKIEKLGQSFDNTNNNLIGITGAEFEVYREEKKADGRIDNQDKFISTYKTGNNGIVYTKQLPIGNYVIRESKAPIGYIKSEQEYPIVISEKSGPNLSIKEIDPIENKIINGYAELTKVGTGSCKITNKCSKPLSGVEFGIYQDLNDNNQIDLNENLPVETITTDKNGYARTKKLKYGHYLVKELKTAINYQISDEIYDFTIKRQNEIVKINDGKSIENKEKIGKIKIIKKAKGTEKEIFLKGAEYTIYDNDQKVVSVLKTNQKGIAYSSNLSFGKYTIKETKAPIGYTLDDSFFEFSIDDKNYSTPDTLVFADQKIANEVSITKIDAISKKALSGASLQLTSQDGKVIEEWISSKKSYKLKLGFGKYKVCELSAPTGYRKINKCTKIKVSENGKSQDIKIANEKLSVSKTGLDNRRSLLIGLYVLICVVLSLLIKIKLAKK